MEDLKEVKVLDHSSVITSDEDYDLYLMYSFMNALKEVENSVKAGYSKVTGTWFPHESVEGGTPTIGYGYKIKPEELKSGLIKLSDGSYLKFSPNGLTNSEVELLFKDCLDVATNKARIEWDSTYGMHRKFDDLPTKYCLVLTGLVFNIGSLKKNGRWQWPSLAKGILTESDSVVRLEMVTTYFNPKLQQRVPLLGRRNILADSLEIV